MTAPLPLLSEDDVQAILRSTVGDGNDGDRSFGCLRSDDGLLPLKALDVDVRIVGTFAHTRLTQTFVNTATTAIEATYIFPLPDRAAATRFVMEVAGRRVEGDLQERGQARATYDRAISQGKRASIAEEERPGTFSLRVGNLMPGESATITLEMTGPLPVVDGEVTYRFPLVVAPRYMPGTPLAGDQVGSGIADDTTLVPDASRISPPVRLADYPNPVRLGIRVAIDAAGLPLSRVRSALHAAWADEREGLLEVKVGAGERLNRDFILRFQLGDSAMRTAARATNTGTLDGDDAFLLTVLPAMTSTTTRPRDVVFVVDRSGSMGGWKMVAARRAVARMVDSLRDSDSFAVLAFDTNVDVCPTLGERLMPATDRHRFQAVEWLATVNDRGGTEMQRPLSLAADLLKGNTNGRDRVLVFVTDGQVGNESQLLNALGKRLDRVRVFALGIDQAVNAGFLNRLSALGAGGEAELVESEDRVDEVLTRCHRRIDTPLLRDLQLSIESGELRTESIAPQRLPDVFSGVPAVVAGTLRRRSGERPTLVVTGVDAGNQRVTFRVPVEASANPALVPAWGRLHVRDLEDRLDGNRGDRQQLTADITRVSLRTKVLCRFTAFVAVDHEVVNEGGRQQEVTQPVESPAGWSNVDAKVSSAPSASSAASPKRRMSAKKEMSSVADVEDMVRGAPSMQARPLSASGPSGASRKPSPSPRQDFDEQHSDGSSPGGEEVVASRSVSSAGAPAPLMEAMEAMEPIPIAPMSRGRSSGAGTLGSLVGRARDAVFGARAEPPTPPAAAEAMPAMPADLSRSSSASSAKDARKESPSGGSGGGVDVVYRDRLVEIVRQLRAGAMDDATEALRLLVEAMAHGGVTPSQRMPLELALRALEGGNVDGALVLLAPLVEPSSSSSSSSSSSRAAGTFWR